MANRAIYDAGLKLRDISDAAETASANEAGVALDIAPNHPDGADDNTGFDYRWKVVVHDVAVTGSPTSVKFVIDTDSEAAFGDTPVEVRSFDWTDETSFELTLSSQEILQLDGDAAAVRIGVEITGGTDPTVDYGAYMTKL